ncbi:MAG: hypothetical protein V4757_02330 [Pseudomonadota bacterium]
MIHLHLIGLAGPKGAGKDTVAQLLATHAKFKMTAFGDALRGQLCQAFSVELDIFTRRDLKDTPSDALAIWRATDNAFIGVMLKHFRKLYGDNQARHEMDKPRSPRDVMKFWANEYRRETESPDYWRRIVVAKIRDDHRRHQWRHVVPDVRFRNEAEVIKNMGGVIWQIQRPGLEADPLDTTETSGAEFAPTVVINNRLGIGHLQDVVMGNWVMAETGLNWSNVRSMGDTLAMEAAAA